MRFYHLSIKALVFRFYLIMAIIIASGFGALYIDPAFWFLSILAFPVFVSCLLGIEFDRPLFHHKLELKHHHALPEKHSRLAH